MELKGYDSNVEYEELLKAQAAVREQGREDLAALFATEWEMRLKLADAIDYLRKEAERLAVQMQRVVEQIEVRGINYRPNGLGEVQAGYHVDAHCGTVHGWGNALAAVQRTITHAQEKEVTT